MEQPAAKTKVAVLGGGVGSIIAAFELTATSALRDRFDVTVYQMGWRLGGKGASGRNVDVRERIEEHGLHIWFGFYENAFAKMREAYVELNRQTGPITSLESAFTGCDQVVLWDPQGMGWHDFQWTFPRNLERPGEGTELPTVWDMALTCINWAIPAWNQLRQDPSWQAQLKLAPPLQGAGEQGLSLAQQLLASGGAPLLGAAAAGPLGDLLVELLTGFRDWLWDLYMARFAGDVYLRLAEPDVRLFFTAFDTFATITAGVVDDDVIGAGFDVLNGSEFCDWLAVHGAKPVTLGETAPERSPLLRAIYDVAFAYEDGDIYKANAAAGTTVSALLRLLFSYRGSLLYRMQAGMGDTVFAPFYEVLVKRGVSFEFFTAVTAMHVAQQGAAKVVDRIDISRQAPLNSAGPYRPLLPGDLPSWPSEPLWNQLAVNRAGAVDYELEPKPLGSQAGELRRGRDFDQVVLGISVGALADLCPELSAASADFGAAIASSRTVRTQAFQVWLHKTAAELGWSHSGNSVSGCYVEPLDTYCDMSHLLPRELWTENDDVHSIAYFCGVLDDRPGEAPGAAAQRVKQNARTFLNHDARELWPASVRAAASQFRWELLVDTRDGTVHEVSGEDRFDSQYWRANVAPSERYVLTPAGTVHLRLPSDRSGFDNLVLAGDWTRNGIDAGCVEAAAVSGLQAAHKLIGVSPPIIGADPKWLRLL
jgi:uncharacterized protein with NAD-binding domain and iron-sulfur cluster